MTLAEAHDVARLFGHKCVAGFNNGTIQVDDWRPTMTVGEFMSYASGLQEGREYRLENGPLDDAHAHCDAELQRQHAIEARKTRQIHLLMRENLLLRKALHEIANGEGYYGAQAREYKQIAAAALANPCQLPGGKSA